MNWLDEALQPEYPNDCDICELIAEKIADLAQIFILPVRLPCGGTTLVGIHNFQVN